MKDILLSTERLHLRLAGPEDAAFLLELMNGPDWIKNIGNRQIHTLTDAQTYIETKFYAYQPGLGGSYLIELQQTGLVIGTCGIYEREYLDIPDIGYSLLPAYYKQGFAFEAAQALLRHARSNWGIGRISGMVIPSNLPSIRLLEKLGLKYESPIEIPNDPEVLHLYIGD
ncbi:MAG: GNAT family N-acetyltransferase [Bacteroidia bacterium]